MNLVALINDFVYFARKHLDLSALDATYVTNRLYDIFDVYPTTSSSKKLNAHDVNYFVKAFSNYFTEVKKLDKVAADIKIASIFDLVSPRPSVVAKKFNKLYVKSPKLATSYLYQLGVNNYYIHKRDIDQNIVWEARYQKGPSLEISINLSKPEKDNKDIAKLLKVKDINYPKCALCLENLGFAGNLKKPPRHNIRIIPMELNHEDWFMQYSPYGYFNEHMILVDNHHEPMEISSRIFALLFAFVDKFNHYTIASNSDLPIVGGSILNHEHFQGGNHVFPLQKAADLFLIKSKRFKHTKISFLDFYNTAFRLKGKDKKEIITIASFILNKWRTYSDVNANIIAKDKEGIHNTITPSLRINSKGEYEFTLILRNNKTNQKYPDGIYHVHPEYFAIKKEGIGVIEAMGRFILPARLVRQIKEVEDVVKHNLNKKTYLKKYPDLVNFDHMVNTLKTNKRMTSKDYINEVGRNILLNTSVFKKDKAGFASLNKFIKSLGL